MALLNHISFREESLVYPGIYIPLDNQGRNKTTLRHSSRNKKKKFAPTKVREVDNLYLVETSLPSARREDILVRAFGNQIVIEARIKIFDENNPGMDQTSKSGLIHFNRKVLLPKNADTEFVRAEYFSGRLRLYIPKISHPIYPGQSTIVVY
jgi:HSP20 family molecular chaperone IbpA